MITKTEYLRLALKSKAYTEFEWLLFLLSEVSGEPIHKELEYHLLQKDGKHFYWLDGEYHPISHEGGPLFIADDPVSLKAGDLANVSEDIDTTLMRILINLYCFVHPCGDLIPFVNKGMDPKFVERTLNEHLVDTPAPGVKVEGKCTSEQFVLAQKGIGILAELSPYIVYASSPKSLQGPPGFAEYKQMILEKYRKEGKDLNDPMVAYELQELFKAYDLEYLKSDPAFSRGIDSKTAKARLKLHLSYGVEPGFGGDDFTPNIIEGLKDGQAANKEEYAVGCNKSRASSYKRGKETANGGTLALLLARLVYDLQHDPNDCGTKRSVPIYIAKGDKRWVGLNLVDRTAITEEVLAANEGKVLNILMPSTCESKTFCSVCMGNRMGTGDYTIQMFATAISDKILSSSLASFHGTELSRVETDLDEVIS